MRTDRRITSALVATLLAAAAVPALACGDRIATRGGQMNEDQGEMNFELVSRGRKFVVYLEDHGQPVPTQGARAVVSISGKVAWSSPLRSDGTNRFAVTLAQALTRGDKVQVDVQFPNGSIANGRFSFGVEPPQRPTFAFIPAPGAASR